MVRDCEAEGYGNESPIMLLKKVNHAYRFKLSLSEYTCRQMLVINTRHGSLTPQSLINEGDIMIFKHTACVEAFDKLKCDMCGLSWHLHR